MASYNIDLTDGSRTIVIPENVVDKDTLSVALIGHGQPNYGEPQNENFIHMLENFASVEEPNMPVKGQIWFKQNEDGQTYELKICKKSAVGSSSAVWDKILKTSSDEEKPQNPSAGDIWYDTNEHKLNVFDGDINDWVSIGPTNYEHNENEYNTTISDSTSTGGTYSIPKELFEKNIYNSEDEESVDADTGSLHMVTLHVLIKEVGKQGSGYNPAELRSCAFIYRFVVRSIAVTEGTPAIRNYDTSIIGAPNYEIIAKSDNLNFTTNLSMSGGDIEFTINNLSTITKTYFVNGIDMEIVRV